MIKVMLLRAVTKSNAKNSILKYLTSAVCVKFVHEIF